MQATRSARLSAESPSMPNDMLKYLCKLLDDDDMLRSNPATAALTDDDRELPCAAKSTDSPATVDSRSASSDSIVDEAVEARGSPDIATSLKSVGSALHETGNCRPCAWFWKPQGCSNAEDCGFCHACPQDEIKSRKKEKLTNIRMKEKQMASQKAAENLSIPNSLPQGMPMLTVKALPPPPMLPPELLVDPVSPPPAPEISPSILYDSAVEAAQSSDSVGSSSYTDPGLIRQDDDEDVSDTGFVTPEKPLRRPEPPATPPPPAPLAVSQTSSTLPSPLLSPAASPLPSPRASPRSLPTPSFSKGSALHNTRECKPCGWFWKPQGCANGAECAHCHLCPDGEMKARRRAKLASMRAADDLARRRAADKEKLLANSPRLPAVLSPAPVPSTMPAMTIGSMLPAATGPTPAQMLFLSQPPAAATMAIAAHLPSLVQRVPTPQQGMPTLLEGVSNNPTGFGMFASVKSQRQRAVLTLADCV
mmetsp:Transcript_130590/g.227032  ORF Transcript_130590/g.227032 Transcript_130590/m.227032 type:complete len:478 (-) Transcript_130590:425-1858(-)